MRLLFILALLASACSQQHATSIPCHMSIGSMSWDSSTACVMRPSIIGYADMGSSIMVKHPPLVLDAASNEKPGQRWGLEEGEVYISQDVSECSQHWSGSAILLFGNDEIGSWGVYMDLVCADGSGKQLYPRVVYGEDD